MFKLAIKLVTLTMILTGVCMFLSTDKAAAAACNGAPGVPNGSWGVTDGIHSNAMAGLRVYAQDGSNGNPLSNTTYVLNSAMPGVPNPLRAANGSMYNPNERIFDYPPGSAGRWSQKSFTTGETLHRGGGPENAFSCEGWSVLGPGTAAQQGNGFVIDCGDFYDANGNGRNDPGEYRSSEYWISSITKPSGQSGHWEIRVDGVTRTPNLDNQPMTRFVATNGDNVRIDLIWHPDPIRPQAEGACQNLKITEAAGSTRTRTWVSVSGVTVGRVHYKHDSINKWWPSQSGPGNLGQQNINTWVGPGNGGDPPNNPDVAGAPAQNGETNMQVSKEWWYQPGANSITVTYRTDQLAGSSWQNGATQYLRNVGGVYSWTTTPTSINCFSATCSNLSIEGTGPNNIVLAGQQYKVKGSYTNTSPPPDYMTIWNPGLVIGGSQVGGNNGNRNVSMSALYSGWSIPIDITLTAPTNITTENLSLTPVYFGPSGAACTLSLPIYQKFNAQVSASSNLVPTSENPNSVQYGATITQTWDSPPPGMPSYNVNNPVNTSFYKRSASGAITQPCSPPSYSSGGPYAASTPGATSSIWSNPGCAIAPGSFQAGDEFCSTVSATYASGYVGPGGGVVSGVGPASASPSCPRVTNKPYFKVKGSGASAGTSIKRSDGTCATGSGGLLAGWNNNADGQERGAGSQLSALALVRITGFASAQRAFNENTGTGAAKLAFANNGPGVDKTVDTEAPALGGNFNTTGYCMNDVLPPTAGGNTTTLPNGSSYGGAASITDSRSVFVNGDVTITGNVTYGATASVDNAPSFVLKASGNIYISPGVTRLDGVFMSDKNIYTCANSSGPITGAGAYNTCKNQLLVHGSFVADQIKLARTYGSLRDEQPNPGAPGGSQIGLVWSCGGSTCAPPISGMRCTPITEPGDPGTWNDNNLCVANDSPVRLAWTYYADNTIRDRDQETALRNQTGAASLNYLKTHGYPYCTAWNVSSVDPGWNDNYLCSNQPVGLNFRMTNDPSQYCTKIDEPADTHGNWVSGYFLCEPKAAGPTGPSASGPPFNNCSNRAGAIRVADSTCAAEIFEFSPELFLSNPAIEEPNGGAPQWDAVTSLPPVL